MLKLASVHMTSNFLLHGRSLPKIIDPNKDGAEIELWGLEQGVVYRVEDEPDVLIPWGMVRHAVAFPGDAFFGMPKPEKRPDPVIMDDEPTPEPGALPEKKSKKKKKKVK